MQLLPVNRTSQSFWSTHSLLASVCLALCWTLGSQRCSGSLWENVAQPTLKNCSVTWGQNVNVLRATLWSKVGRGGGGAYLPDNRSSQRLFFKKDFLIWTIFKVFIEFVTILLLFYVLFCFFDILTMRHVGSWLPTRYQTCTPCIGRERGVCVCVCVCFNNFIYLFLAVLGLR